jgi:hypothetical protein
MTMVQPISAIADRVMAALVAGLEIEFGRGAAEGLAARFLEAEECDFCWDARVEERWLGAWPAFEGGDIELDRVVIFGTMAGRWFVATCIVDGDEMPHGMMAKRYFSSRKRAAEAFARQR